MTSDPGTLPADTTVGRAALRVDDVGTVTEFYRDVVGLSVRSEEPDEMVLGTADRPLLELVEDRDRPARSRDEAGLFHTAFRVPDRTALADALARIEESWRLQGASDHRVSEALYLTDPAGNGVEIYRDRPRSEWPTAADGSVEMATDPLDLEPIRNLGEGVEAVPPATTVGHVHIEVTSIDTARSFYVDGLGLNVRATYGSDALFLAAGDYHHHLGVNVWNGRSAPRQGRGLDWFEFVLPDESALSDARDRLHAAGFEPGVDDGYLRVADPDGIRIRLRVDSSDG